MNDAHPHREKPTGFGGCDWCIQGYECLKLIVTFMMSLLRSVTGVGSVRFSGVDPCANCFGRL